MPRLPNLFLHYANIRHHHAAINSFAHVVNGGQAYLKDKANLGIGQRNTLQQDLVLQVE
jgi:hypothetical protein